MHLVFVRGACCVVAVGLVLKLCVCAHAQQPDKNAAAIRKALDQQITLDFASQNLEEGIDHLRQKTKLNIILDTYVVAMAGFGGHIGGGLGGLGGVGGIGLDAGKLPPMPVTLKSNNGKVRTALQNMLTQYHLTYVILRDSVLITTEDVGYQRQMRQRVNVDTKEMTLMAALEHLADETGVNLLIDPRQLDKAKNKITVRLDDVTLETAVRLLTELADLSSARVGNVLFVTTDARAEKLRKENAAANPNNQGAAYSLPFPGMPNFGGPIGGFGGAIGGFPGQPGGLIPPPIAVVDPPPPVEQKKEAK